MKGDLVPEKRVSDHSLSAQLGAFFNELDDFTRLFREGMNLDLLRADGSTDPTTLAVVQIKAHYLAVFYENAGIGAVDPANQALGTLLLVPQGAEGPPPAGLIVHGIAGLHDEAANGDISPTGSCTHVHCLLISALGFSSFQMISRFASE
jgi:hypothetical protein